jgi:uncharacterized cofD-like protein
MLYSEPFNLVAIGGGTGLATLLGGLKPYVTPPAPTISLTAIVTVTDDGRSSGRLRSEFAVLPPGDIRNCLVALADDNHLLTQLLRYRFPGDGPVGGHSLGNLIMLALSQIRGDFLKGLNQLREMLGIEARVLPSTLDRVDLVARIGGEMMRGQVSIKSRHGPIRNLALTPPFAEALPEAAEAIRGADLITLGPGSLFTSVIANLLVKGIAEALVESRAKKLYICNAMTEFDETDGFSAVDHLRGLLEYVPGLRLDYVLFNSAPISPEMRDRYAAEKAIALEPPGSAPADLKETRFISLPLASESRFVRHDPERLSRAILEIYRESNGSHLLPGFDLFRTSV